MLFSVGWHSPTSWAGFGCTIMWPIALPKTIHASIKLPSLTGGQSVRKQCVILTIHHDTIPVTRYVKRNKTTQKGESTATRPDACCAKHHEPK
eukprot:scaffold129436_cov15-Tisochrysis_lutea.AAC.1